MAALSLLGCSFREEPLEPLRRLLRVTLQGISAAGVMQATWCMREVRYHVDIAFCRGVLFHTNLTMHDTCATQIVETS